MVHVGPEAQAEHYVMNPDFSGAILLRRSIAGALDKCNFFIPVDMAAFWLIATDSGKGAEFINDVLFAF